MNLILSDCPLALQLPPDGTSVYVDLSQKKIANCVGCFGCWTKTPGKCVIRDDAVEIYPLIAQSDRVLYVSRVRYGGYDAPMKTMLERSIPVQQAFLRLLDGETHHVQRAVRPKIATILAYGVSDAEEKALFERLVERNARNMNFQSWNTIFCSEEHLAEMVQKEVRKWQTC